MTQHRAGLADHLIAAGDRSAGACGVETWRDVVGVAAGSHHTVVTTDGRASAVGGNDAGQCDVADWREIVAVAAGSRHTLGLRADGTVLAAGSNEHGQCDVAGWPPIRR